MKTQIKSGAETNAADKKMSWASLQEVGRQFFYGLTCLCLAIFWVLLVAYLVTAGDAPVLEVVGLLIGFAVFAAAATSIISFFSESVESMRKFTEELKETAFLLTLIPAIFWMVRIIRDISRYWRKR